MSDGPTSTKRAFENAAERHQAPIDPGVESSPELHLAVVQYEAKSDLGTIYPPGLSGVERMDTWISAAMTEFVDLEAWR